MNPWNTWTHEEVEEENEEEEEVRPSPLTREIILASPHRMKRRRGYGWYKCVKNDTELAAASLASIHERQRMVAVQEKDETSSGSYRAPPRALQRAMAYYTSEEERQRFLDAQPVTPLWVHQRRGVAFLRERERQGGPNGGIVAYKMRAGKTLMMAAAILEDLQAHVRAGGRRFGEPTLFLAPKQALATIASQFNQHFGPVGQCALNVVLISSKHPFVTQSMNWTQELLGSYDVIITSYSLLVASYRRKTRAKNEKGGGDGDEDVDVALPHSERNGPTLLDLRYRRIIADEAHVFCNQETQLFSAMMTLEARSRWFMTGTPIRNSAADLLSPLAFLRVPGKLPAIESADFRALLQRIMIRELDDEGLPAHETRPVAIDDRIETFDFSSAIERRLYTHVQTRTQSLLRRSMRTRRAKENKLTLILRLRQICVDPHLIADIGNRTLHSKFVFERFGAATWSVDGFLQDALTVMDLCPVESAASPPLPNDPRRALVSLCDAAIIETRLRRLVPLVSTKERYILRYYEKCIEGTDEKLIVFSAWASFLERLGRIFDLRARLRGEASVPHVMVHGEVENHEELFATFRTNPACKVMLITMGTGNVSLDLSCANHVIIPDPWFNPFAEEQAISRVLGSNQTRPVHIRRLCIRDTIDEEILRLAASKKGLERLLTADQGLATQVNERTTAILVAWILAQDEEEREEEEEEEGNEDRRGIKRKRAEENEGALPSLVKKRREAVLV